MSDLNARILAELQRHVGKASAISSTELMAAVGVKDNRQVRDAIHQLRVGGHGEICSISRSPGGFYLAATLDELKEYQNQIISRRNEMSELLKAVYQAEEGWGKRKQMALQEGLL